MKNNDLKLKVNIFIWQCCK